MNQNPFCLMTPESQGDHVFHCAGGLLVEPVKQGTATIEVGHVRLCGGQEKGIKESARKLCMHFL